MLIHRVGVDIIDWLLYVCDICFNSYFTVVNIAEQIMNNGKYSRRNADINGLKQEVLKLVSAEIAEKE